MTPHQGHEDTAPALQPVQTEGDPEVSVVAAVSHRSVGDWVWFWVLTVLWAMSFPLTRMAVKLSDPERGLPPEAIVAGRMTIGAIVLIGAVIVMKEKFPPLRDWKRWGIMFVMGAIGMTLPFWLITYAQKTVNSSLAALYIATAPLFVAVLAHFIFHDERLHWRMARGLAIGFVGVALLFGPDAVTQFGSASVFAQFLCLIATTCYAVETVLARGAPTMPPVVLSAGFVSFGALFSWFGLFNADWSAHTPDVSSWIAVVGLGVGPTALAALFYMLLVQRTNATFLALTGYTIPVVSALIGFLAYGEVQAWHSFVAFGLILVGVWVSQNTSAKEKRPS